MYKKQIMWQKIICFAAIAAGAVVFLYALGLMTDLYDSLYYTMTRDEFYEKFMKRGMGSFTCPGGRLEVDTTDFANVHPDRIVEQVAQMLL